jgi:hypothetical protein
MAKARKALNIMVTNNSRKKLFTRAKAEALLASGANPNEDRFVKHENYHVRQKAWKKAGMPLPENEDERAKFLSTIHIKNYVNA